MDNIPRPKGRYQVAFVLMAGLMVCSLFVGIFGTVLLDAFGGDDGGGNQIEIDASVEKAYRSTAEANPQDPVAAAALANYLANTNKLAEAIPYYERSIELDPNNPVVRLDFARSLTDGGMYADAELQYQQAIDLDPTNAEAHFYLGELYYTMQPQRTNDAIDQYQATIELDSTSFIAVRAQERLVELGVATPHASPSPGS